MTVQVVACAAVRLATAVDSLFFAQLPALPAPVRRPPHVVAKVLAENFPGNRHLSPSRAEKLLETLGKSNIAGGSVYDALIAATALEHNLKLATRDQRALVTYRALQVDVEVLTGQELGRA